METAQLKSQTSFSLHQELQSHADFLQPFLDEQEQDFNRLGEKSHKRLISIWQPQFKRPKKAKTHFEKSLEENFIYSGHKLFPHEKNQPELLIGALAYHVEAEAVVSFGNRLSEIGLQRFFTTPSQSFSQPLVLQENPNSPYGKQSLLIDASEEKLLALNASLIEGFATQTPIVYQTQVSANQKNKSYHIEFTIPQDISWDGRTHKVHLNFQVPIKEEGSFTTKLLKFLKRVNGRPAQHYQNEAAAVIHLREIIFAKAGSIELVLDPGSDQEQRIQPDKLWGKKLCLALSQTAGGFFEKSFYQSHKQPEVLFQKLANGHIAEQSLDQFSSGNLRYTTIHYQASPYQTRYVEEKIDLENNDSAYEMKEMALYTGDYKKLMNIVFQTSKGRGIRDLSYFSSHEQHGRFKIALDGEDGFSYGDFTVSATQKLAEETFYHAVVLRPTFPKDMKTKKIVIHVLKTKNGTHTETQVVPLQQIAAPKNPLIP